MSFEIIIVLFLFLVSIVFAWFTTLFTFIPDLFLNWKFRHHLPLVSGLFIVGVFLWMNPQQEPGSLYWLKGWSQYLLLPVFLYAPLPYLKKMTNVVPGKDVVFLGSIITSNLYFVFQFIGNFYLEEFQEIDPLIWVAGISIPAFFIYFGLFSIKDFVDRHDESRRSSSHILILVCIAALLILWLPLAALSLPEGDMCGGTIPVMSIEPSTEVSAIPNATIIHLSQEDFGTYPELGSYLKKHHVVYGRYQKTFEGKNFTVESLPGIHFRCGSESRMYAYGALENWEGEPKKFVEYDGKIYYLSRGYIA